MKAFLLFLPISLIASHAVAKCNFDKPIGSCQARIVIESTSGSKGSYSAEAMVKSSAASCSKVDYFVDNTPYLTVIKSGNSEGESFFGTKPISSKSIEIKKCTQYASTEEANGKNAEAQTAAAGTSFFQGHWKGSAGFLFVRGPVEVTLSVNGNHATGNTYFPGNGITKQVNATIHGNSLSYSYDVQEHVEITLTRKTDNTVAYSGTGSGVTINGSLTRQ